MIGEKLGIPVSAMAGELSFGRGCRRYRRTLPATLLPFGRQDGYVFRRNRFFGWEKRFCLIQINGPW
jgi:hypothetical protein